MDRNVFRGAAEKARVILPVILRISFCLAMWTLGAMTMTIAEAQTQERARLENLQRSVDSGRDTWRGIRLEKIMRISLDWGLRDGFHQREKIQHPSTEPPGGPDHAARRNFRNEEFSK